MSAEDCHMSPQGRAVALTLLVASAALLSTTGMTEAAEPNLRLEFDSETPKNPLLASYHGGENVAYYGGSFPYFNYEGLNYQTVSQGSDIYLSPQEAQKYIRDSTFAITRIESTIEGIFADIKDDIASTRQVLERGSEQELNQFNKTVNDLYEAKRRWEEANQLVKDEIARAVDDKTLTKAEQDFIESLTRNAQTRLDEVRRLYLAVDGYNTRVPREYI